ncbi:hypothetical protein JCM8202_001449 [Rhodotorula sphaerocarpa]
MSTVPAQALPPPESPMEEKDNLKITGAETMLEYADIQGESGDVVHTVDGVSWTQEEERAIVKRYDWNIVTIVFTLFMLSFLDRSNIGNANTAGMSKYLGMTDGQFQWLLTIFYIGYSCGQPTTLLWKLVPPRLFVAFLTLCWGGFALLQAAAGWEGLMALRLLLGVAETAFSPGVPLYLSFFYSRREIGFRQGIFLAGAPLASCYAGALAYGISHIKTSSLPVYKLLFLIEGAPAIPMAAVAYFFLPDKPSQARFLTPRQQEIARLRVARDGDTGRESRLKWRGVLNGLKDHKAWICSLMYFSCNVSYSSLPVFLPAILKDMGYSSIRAQGLSAPPNLAAFFVLLSVTFASDRVGDRTAFIIPLATMGGIGYLLLAVVKLTAVRYFAIFLVAAGIFPTIGLILPLVSSLHEDDSKRSAAFMILNLIGQLGPFVGTRMYPTSEAPYYKKGMAVCCGFILLVACLATLMRFLLMHENRVRDRKYGYVDPKKQEALQERAVRDRLAETTAQQKKEGTNTGEGQEVEGATPTMGKEKTAEEKQADRERYWRYLL